MVIYEGHRFVNSIRLRHLRTFAVFLLLGVQLQLCVQSDVFSRTDEPHLESRTHTAGKMYLKVDNTGILGINVSSYGTEFNIIEFDSLARSYPKGSPGQYPFPTLVVVGIVQGDTIRSTRFLPGSYAAQTANDEFMSHSKKLGVAAQGVTVPMSEEITCVYSDTLFDGIINGNPLSKDYIKPPTLNIQITQRSYAYSIPGADDFVLIDYTLTNIGHKLIQGAYVGFGSSIFTWRLSTIQDFRVPLSADVFGYLPNDPTHNSDKRACAQLLPPRGVWFASGGGYPEPGSLEFDSSSVRGAMAIAILSPENNSLNYGFNWWDDESGIGPRQARRGASGFRTFETGLASPTSDGEYYYMMASGEEDYDRHYLAIDHTINGWLPPPSSAAWHALPLEWTFSSSELSVGPFDISSGESVDLTIAYVGGEDFHVSPSNVALNWNPLDPKKLLDGFNFKPLVRNITNARWTYDNPGFDTDGDGYKGEYQVCDRDSIVTRFTRHIDTINGNQVTYVTLDTLVEFTYEDTVWIEGDGVPDYRPAVPPAKPVLKFTTSEGKIILDWNGLESETTPDLFTHELDFEGYRVYIGLTPREKDLTLASSYDREDYTQWYFDEDLRGSEEHNQWIVIHKPFTADEARVQYASGSIDWHPLDNDIDHKLRVNDSVFYFTPQDWNQSDLTDTTTIHKLYPNEPKPHTLILDSAFTEDTWYTDPITGEDTFYEGGELTPDGKRFKFYEYRYIFENLLPSQQYHISVTAFDFGSPESGIPFLETNPSATAIEALAQDRIPQDEELDVIVYPNPYRVDGNYREIGFEGRGREELLDDRVRAVHFANLPPQCEIRIYSLDGDLIRQLFHDKSADDPSSMHEIWNVITRNLQKPVSGIYYWVVQTPDGRQQIGKLVLIM